MPPQTRRSDAEQFAAIQRAEAEQEFDLRIQSVIDEMKRLGYPVRLISKKRTAEQQRRLYAQGRTQPGRIVTYASGEPGKESFHQSGRAADFVFEGRSQPWDLLGRVAKEHGLGWGGDWTTLVDRPHVELTEPQTRVFPRGGRAEGVTNPASVRVSVEPPSSPFSPTTTQAAALPAPRPSRPPVRSAEGFTDPASVRVTPPTRRALPPLAAVPPVVSAKTGARAAPPRPPVRQAEGVTDPASVRVTPAPGTGTEPLRPASWPEIIASIARDEGLDPALTVALAERENEPFDPNAPPSSAGALGLMQVKPETAAQYGKDATDPIQNIQAGVLHLKRLMAKYGGSPDKALAAYTAGEKAIDEAGGVPADNPTVQGYLYGDNRPGVFERIPKYARFADPPKTKDTTKTPTGQQPKIAAAPGWGWQTLRDTLPTTGAMLGGFQGARWGLQAGTPFGPWGMAAGVVAGSVLGAYFGGGAGETVEVGVETLAKKMGVPGTETLQPVTGAGAASRIAGAGETAAKAEIIGSGIVGPVITKAAAPFAGSLIKESGELRQLMGDTPLLPAQISGSKLLRIFQSVIEESIGGSGPIGARRAEQQAAVAARVEELKSDLGPRGTAETAGQTVQQRLPRSAVSVAEERLQQEQAAAATRQVANERLLARAEADIAARRAAGELTQAQAEAEMAARRAANERIVGRAEAETTAQRTANERILARAEADIAARRGEEAARQATLTTEAAEEVARRQQALGGPVGPQAAGEAALAVREAEITQFRAEERAAWGLFEQEGESVLISEAPKLHAFLQRQGQRRGGVLPSPPLTAGQRAGELVVPPSTALPEAVLVEGQMMKLADMPPEMRRVVELSLQTQRSATQEVQAVTAVQFADAVSDLGILARALDRAAKTDPSKFLKQAGLAKKIYQFAREDLLAALGPAKTRENPVTTAVREAYEAATATTRAGQRRLFNQTMVRLAKLDPEGMATRLMGPNKGTAIRVVTRALGDTGMQPVRAAGLQRLVARDVKTGEINWAGTIGNMNRAGDESLTALFPNGEPAALRRLAEGMFEAERLATVARRADEQAIAAMQAGAETTGQINKAALADMQAGAAGAQARNKQAVAALEARIQAAERGDKEALKALKAGVAAEQATDAQAIKAAKDAVAAAKAQPDLLAPLRDEAQTAKVLGKLFQKDNVATINAVREAVGPDAFQTAQRLALDEMTHPDPVTGQIDWHDVVRRLGPKSIDAESLKAMFPNGHAERLRRIAELMVIAERREGRGRLVVGLTEAGIIVNLLAFRFPKTAATIALAPPVLSRLLASETGSRWLAEGLIAKPYTMAAGRAAAQVVAFLRQDIAEEKAKASSASPAEVSLTLRGEPSAAGTGR